MAGERARAEAIEPQRAAVAPRVRVLPGGGAAQPLERVVRGLIESGARGAVLLRAPAGGGKSAALAHLRAVLPDELQTRIELLDEPQAERIATSYDSLAIVALPLELPRNWLLR